MLHCPAQMLLVMPLVNMLLATAAAPPPAAPTAACAAELDAWCAQDNNTLGKMNVCLATMKRQKSTLPMVAAFTASKKEGVKWRCYSPDNLSPATPLLARKYHCPTSGPGTGCQDACSGAGPFLEKLLRKCDPAWVPPPPPPPPPCPTGTVCPVTVIERGMKAPDGELISGAHEPALLYMPPDPKFPASVPNGTLMVQSGIDPANPPKGVPQAATLGMRLSNDLGASWSLIRFPFLPFSDIKTVGAFFQNQVAWDAEAKTAHIVIGNITDHAGGCDGGSEALNGMLHISSADRGQTWTQCKGGSCNMILPKSPTTCLAPTSGAGVQMTQEGPHKGRLLFMGVHNAYHGDVVAYSDDHGKTFQSSGALHQSGLDEGSIAQLPNGSLFTIFRNCFLPGGKGCQGSSSSSNANLTSDELGAARPEGTGGKRFFYSISNDGGIHWTKPKAHVDLVTPVCQGSITGYDGALYFAGPYSETGRHNLTILASDDNGATFTRSLVITPGSAGYTGLQCGIASGPHDCAVVFDAGGKINYMPFSTKDVKAGHRHPSAPAAAAAAAVVSAVGSPSPTAATTITTKRGRYEVFMNERWPASCPVNLKRPQVGLPDWKSFGILANPGSAFCGPVIATIYKCGTFPHFTGMSAGNWNASNATAVYGGLPQLLDLGAHLAQVQKDIVALIPDKDSSGVANIDWEAWKPNFKDNSWNEYWIYINRSITLVQQQHPDWTSEKQVAQAEVDFNAASQKLWNSTIDLCRSVAPRASLYVRVASTPSVRKY